MFPNSTAAHFNSGMDFSRKERDLPLAASAISITAHAADFGTHTPYARGRAVAPDALRRSYRRNGTRGFVQSLSVTRGPADAKLFAYTAQRITAKSALKTEFAAVTDVALNAENDRHRFVRDTLRDAGIEPVPMEGFAVWVAKLKPLLQ